MLAAVAADARFLQDSTFEADYEVLLNPNPRGFVPIAFNRTIDSSGVSWEIGFSERDSAGDFNRAWVTIQKDLEGTLNIALNDTYAAEGVYHVQHNWLGKPLRELWQRQVVLRRVSAGLPWEAVSLSPARIQSLDLVDGSRRRPRVVRVALQGALADTTLSDFSTLFPIGELISFAPGESLTITVETLDPDDVVSCANGYFPTLLEPRGDNTYVGRIAVRATTGRANLAVSAVDHETIYDAAEPYHGDALLIPCRVVEPGGVAAP